jgi:peptidoglycan/xylan/chitin deacetylase (PgdA/CDA1 family)
LISQWIHNRFYERGGPAWILLYHRIADVACDPWDLCVQPKAFDQQLQDLKKKYTVLPLEEIVHQWRRRQVMKNAVAVTFDDGYLDNFTDAMPLLEHHDIPATFFITGGPYGDNQAFWWDELQALLFESEVLPAHCSFNIDGIMVEQDLGDEQYLDSDLKLELRQWKSGMLRKGARLQLYYGLWEVLKFSAQAIRDEAMEAIRAWAASGNMALPVRMNNEQIMVLHRHKLFTIGAHTVSHPALSVLEGGEQLKEMHANKTALENLLRSTIQLLAYPYGNYNELTLALSKKAGFEAAFTTEVKPVNNCRSRFAIGRVVVSNATKTFNL